MPEARKCLKKPRSTSFHKQNGYCYYCEQPMWIDDRSEFASLYNITFKQAKALQCTGEHLIAHAEGGGVSESNIVAACLFCNRTRHKRASPPSPNEYKTIVRRRLQLGRWHGFKFNKINSSHI